MFESITKGLEGALSFLRGQTKLTEKNIREALQAVRQSLLEADVNYDVAQSFCDRVARVAVGTEVLDSLKPFEQFVGVVHRELIQLMGPVDHTLNLAKGQVGVIMMCGLQGSGKTTTCGKLAKMLQGEGWRPLLVAADLQRPAAIDQLKIIGEQLGVPVYTEPPTSNPVTVCQNGVALARKQGNVDVVILDTAGRLHIDDELMQELKQIDRTVEPDQVLLVCDAMTGQDAVNSAKVFNAALELNGVVLTKLDGDARGGAALSVKSVTGVPIKYIGVGEQLDKLEMFHPDRMASRILGMGDVLTLFEKAQQHFDAEQMAAQQEKLRKGKFTLTDFRNQMQQVKKLGSFSSIMKMIPGMGRISEMMNDADMDPEQDLGKIEAIISSMTEAERENPEIIDISRRRRIAAGSGTEPSMINKLLKEFANAQKMMQNMAGQSHLDRLRSLQQMASMGAFDPGAEVSFGKNRSARAEIDKEKKKRQRKDAKKQRKKNRR
ncbi:MAG: signal recognition particle protein [Planctomycetota bacterium]|nr:signal recognition particle protein [Planctomycetota bacterium]